MRDVRHHITAGAIQEDLVIPDDPYDACYANAGALHRAGARVTRSQSAYEEIVAETKGFEPSRRFPAYTLSKRAPSTTRPPLLYQSKTKSNPIIRQLK